MKIIFKKPGKYKNGVPVKEVSQIDVDQEKVFEIVDSNAVAYVDTGSAKQYKGPKAKPVKVEKPKTEVKPEK